MAFKFICFASLLALASAVEPTAQYHQGAYGEVPVAYKTHHVEAEAPAHYDFSYSVNDQHTGDVKEHKESRQGDSVRGHYSLVDADGHKRTVEYTVDGHSGFVAVVHREPIQGYVPAKVVTKVHQAPVYQQTYSHAAPVVKYQQAYSAPVAKVAAYQTYEAPVAKVAAPVYQTYQTAHVAKVAAPVAYQTYQKVEEAPAVYHHAQAPAYQQTYTAKVAAPVAYQAYAKVASPVAAYQAHVAPVTKVATQQVYTAQAPVYQQAYATPVAKVAAAPAYQTYAAAPVAKVAAAPASYVHGAGHTYVSYTGPNSSYHY